MEATIGDSALGIRVAGGLGCRIQGLRFWLSTATQAISNSAT